MIKLIGVLTLVGGTVIWAAAEPGSPVPGDPPHAAALAPECELAEEWVTANLDALPTTLADLSKHSMTLRRAIYRALDTETRISLWQENLAEVAREATLTEQQRLFVKRVSHELSGHLRDTTPQSELDVLAKEAKAVLGEDLARRAIASLGPEEAPITVTENGNLVNPDCSCSVQSPFCGFPRMCKIAQCHWTAGCGFLWLFICNGFCYSH